MLISKRGASKRKQTVGVAFSYGREQVSINGGLPDKIFSNSAFVIVKWRGTQ